MLTKRSIVVLTSVAVVGLLSTAAWNAFAAGDPEGWPPDLGPRLDGAWVLIQAANDIAVLHTSFNVAQDPQGLRYTTYVDHSECSPSIWGFFPEANAHSPMIGVTEKTGPKTTKGTIINYGLKRGGLQDEIVYICVTSWDGTLVDNDHTAGQATLSFYLPAQDANHDGLPDEGEKPVMCIPYEATGTRVKLMPMCSPTPLPEAPKP